jgi:cobalt-zinc-cadmium efflux system membrane fusion protein
MTLLLLLFGCSLLDRDRDGDEAPGAEAPATQAAAEVVLDPAALAKAGITTAPAAVGQLPRVVEVPGTLALDPTREARVSAPVEGQVVRILAKVGDPVAAGASLAVLRSTEIADARAASAAARAHRVAALARRDRVRLLLADGVSSQAQLLDAEAEFADADGAASAAAQKLTLYGLRPDEDGADAPLRAMVAGEVLEASATVGNTVAPDEVLFHVGNLDTLLLLLAVPDAQLTGIAKGQAVTFTIAGHTEPFPASVDAVGSWVEPASRTVNVRAIAPNPGRELRPNQFADATIQLDEADGESGVLLPADAVQSVDGHDVVFVAGDAGHFTPRPVTVEERAGERVRLESGVEAGENVVVTGAFALKGQLVKGDMGGDDD